jgi:hypothetical protein
MKKAAKSSRGKKVPAAAAPAAVADDPRVTKLVNAFRDDPRLAPVIVAFEASKLSKSGGSGRKFGSNGLKVKGKLFALFTQGTLVVKLPPDRVAALVDRGTGVLFDPGHGRLMKGWLTVVSPKASWVDLAREAHDFVEGVKGKT